MHILEDRLGLLNGIAGCGPHELGRFIEQKRRFPTGYTL